MPFVQGICPNCGGTLAVDNTKDAAVCQYCNTPFIIEKAINQFNINAENIQVSNINNMNVNVNGASGTDSVDDKAKACEVFLQALDWKNAKPIIDVMIKNYPSDYRGHWFNLLYMTHNFAIYTTPIMVNGRVDPGTLHRDMQKEFETACRLASVSHPEMIESMNKRYSPYRKRYIDDLNAKAQSLSDNTRANKGKNIRLFFLIMGIIIVCAFVILGIGLIMMMCNNELMIM